MILNIDDKVKFYCYHAGIDMRKGIHSLYQIAKVNNMPSILHGDAFVFIGSNQKSVKILRWHNEGFLLYHKKLEVGRYNLPTNTGDLPFQELTISDVDTLLGRIRHRRTTNELRWAVFAN